MDGSLFHKNTSRILDDTQKVWASGGKEKRECTYVEYILANCCMPTLLKKKPSSLLSFRKKNIKKKKHFFYILYKEIQLFQCEFTVLSEDIKTWYVLIYQKKMLKEYLQQHAAHPLLEEYFIGSGKCDLKECLKKIQLRFEAYKLENRDFPHELGFFFGYPVKDVEDYILYAGKNYLFCGYWKVYSNLETAVKIFQLYDQYKEKALQLLFSGKKLQEINTYI